VPDVTRPVAIVGAGPVGLAPALGLARHGVRSVVIEQAPATSEHWKAAGIHVRTREILRRWGGPTGSRADLDALAGAVCASTGR
jgi:2-polyprenyl-6-methoxyphenol hydroxylase-like FAD-dependent oxidoreductase